MVRIVGSMQNGPKCHGMHPKVVGYVCPYCGAGKGRQKQQSGLIAAQGAKPSKATFINLPKSTPILRVIGNKINSK